ncbi:MAG: UbiA family prenyltransferase [Candidatus Peribacteria bacterium]|jgi:4-hydroxybenzoate polyprenyltransferase|nr:UbiA family prenyltransferase [Candidatus Peribacteria bacterium]
MRPPQIVKNGLILLPLLFSGELFQLEAVGRVLGIFVIFSVFVGSTYVINDYKDRVVDRSHPEKKKRPLASGKLHAGFALTFAMVLIVLSLIGAYRMGGVWILLLFLLYWINTTLYTLRVKHLVILDVFSIALGMVMRGVIGIAVLQAVYSIWFLLVIFFGALWFGYMKRYQEVQLGTHSRKILTSYNASFLEQIIGMITTVLITTYSFYTFNSVQSIRIVLSLPVFVFCIIRFYYTIFFQKNYQQAIERIIFSDPWLWGSTVLYLVLTMGIVYFC